MVLVILQVPRSSLVDSSPNDTLKWFQLLSTGSVTHDLEMNHYLEVEFVTVNEEPARFNIGYAALASIIPNSPFYKLVFS
jgi:hypothetical protein